MIEMKQTKTASKGIVIVLVVICIILVAGLGGAIVVSTSIINDKNNTISSLDTQISKLGSNVTNLQKQIALDNATVNSLVSNITNLRDQLSIILNESSSIGDIVMRDPSAWVNRTVIVEGNDLGLVVFPPFENSPWNYELISGNQTIGVVLSTSVNVTAFWKSLQGFKSSEVIIYGVVVKGEITSIWEPSEVTYYIEGFVV